MSFNIADNFLLRALQLFILLHVHAKLKRVQGKQTHVVCRCIHVSLEICLTFLQKICDFVLNTVVDLTFLCLKWVLQFLIFLFLQSFDLLLDWGIVNHIFARFSRVSLYCVPHRLWVATQNCNHLVLHKVKHRNISISFDLWFVSWLIWVTIKQLVFLEIVDAKG